MIKCLSVFVVCALLSGLASAQSVEDRLRELERRVEQLEKQLASPAPGAVTPKPAAAPAVIVPTAESWRALKRGMSENAVRALLGEPTKINSFSTFWVWQYPGNAQVQIDRRAGVESWTEPR